MRAVGEKWIFCTVLAFGTKIIHRHNHSRRGQWSQSHRILLTNKYYNDDEEDFSNRDNSITSRDFSHPTRRLFIRAILCSSAAHFIVLTETPSANAACLSGDIRPECIGVYKLPIDAAESPYVATPEKLKLYAPDLQWVPPTAYPSTFADAFKSLLDMRQQLDIAQDRVSRGKVEEAGLVVLDIMPKVNAAGIVIVRMVNAASNNERNLAMKIGVSTNIEKIDGNPSTTSRAVSLEMKAYRTKTSLDELMGYLGETDVLIGQGLRGELGVSAPAQLQILSSLSDCCTEFDNLLRIIATTVPNELL